MVSLLSVMVPARVTVTCSRYVLEEFTRTWFSSREVVVVHNGVPLNSTVIRDSGPGVREEFGVAPDTPLVLMVSRLQWWKGVHVFIDAASSIAKANPNVQFIIVGAPLFGLEEDYPTLLREQIVRLGLQRRVRLAGYRSDVGRFFAAADIVVHSSIDPEPFGMVLIEAMAASKPVIASDLGGPREIVEDGRTGILVPPGRPEELGLAILRLVTDPKRRAQMGEAGARRVHSCFSAQQMVKRLESLYAKLATERVSHG
jgi:glycosyltransferase involved in cell wall biosynthesis